MLLTGTNSGIVSRLNMSSGSYDSCFRRSSDRFTLRFSDERFFEDERLREGDWLMSFVPPKAPSLYSAASTSLLTAIAAPTGFSVSEYPMLPSNLETVKYRSNKSVYSRASKRADAKAPMYDRS